MRPAPAGPPLHIGTCGFSCSEWVEAGVYPAATRPGQMLALYSRLFAVVVISYIWYQMVRAETMARMLITAGPDLRICAKLIRTLTHEIAADWRDQATRYRQGLQPLADSGRLLAVLVHLPPSFHHTLANRGYLARLGSSLQVRFLRDGTVRIGENP